MDQTANSNGPWDGPAVQDRTGDDYLPQVMRALEAVHGSGTTNEVRKEATIYLENARQRDDAPYQGFNLASQKTQPAHVRLYALSMIEHAVRRFWDNYSAEQALALRNWVLQLAHDVEENEPAFVRNKVAQIWTEIAKRSWAKDWLDMDQRLVELWSKTLVHKELVASVLESLADDIFNREDPVATLRGADLSKACVNIFTPASVLSERFPSRETDLDVRYGEEGWFARLGDHLGSVQYGNQSDVKRDRCIMKVLETLKASVGWAIPKALAVARCVERVCGSLTSSILSIQTASLEVLHVLYSRSHFEHDDFHELVRPMFFRDSVSLLHQIYEWSVVGPSDIDEEKYSFCCKFSEMVSLLAEHLNGHALPVGDEIDVQGFLKLMLGIVSNQSLTVSIPLVRIWVRLLRSDTLKNDNEMMHNLMGPLLEICGQRLIRYESFPENVEDPTYAFLNEDIDTVPERHAFLGNYRRYCVQMVEQIAHRQPFEGIYLVLHQVEQSLQKTLQEQQSLTIENYSRALVPSLKLDAQFVSLEAALRGYRSWIEQHSSHPQQNEYDRNMMEQNLESWGRQILDMEFRDLLVRKKILQLCVTLSMSALNGRTDFLLFTLKHILTTQPPEDVSNPAYAEAARELQNECTKELQRLAMKMPDVLLMVYDDLEGKVNEITASDALTERQKLSLYCFLFTINHRATSIDGAVRQQRLHSFVDPLKNSWRDPHLDQSLSTFDGFCGLVGVERVQQYLVNKRADKISDWSAHQLDEEGRAIQMEMNEALQQLNLKPSKAFLGTSFDKLENSSETHKVSVSLWHDSVPIMVPNVLKFLRFAHSFHNPQNWTGLPQDMHPLVGRLLTDRFWQSGISSGSKDDFYARVSNSKATLEGFASSVRSVIRSIRETCYSILYCMTKMSDYFYGYGELPQALSEAFFSDVKVLSAHQLLSLMNVMRYIVDDCPPSLRQQFLPPVLSGFFTEIGSKISGDWSALDVQAQAAGGDDNLLEEMKGESIIRQLTYMAVIMVAGVLDPARLDSGRTVPHNPEADYSIKPLNGTVTQPNSMRAFILSSPSILHPLLTFSCQVLRIRDTRCCGIMIRVFRSIIPDFTSPEIPIQAEIREFICTDVFKAAISSLNEPYFVDLQKDLAQFIATVYTLYNTPTLSNKPHEILLSLPGIDESKLNRTAKAMLQAKSARQLRALVLDLLADVRGVSISEQGRLTPKPTAQAQDRGAQTSSSLPAAAKERRSAMQAQFMSVDEGGAEGQQNGTRDRSPDLGGVAELFG